MTGNRLRVIGNRLLAGLIMFPVVFIAGCGSSSTGAAGPPGSTGTGSVMAKVVIILASHLGPDNKDYGNSWFIDAVQSVCSTSTNSEPFSSDSLALTVKGTPLYEKYPPLGNLTVTHYTVEYFPQNISLPPLSPIIAGHTLTIVPDGKTEVRDTFLIFNLDNKSDFYEYIRTGKYSPSQYPALYDMIVTFYGKDDNGKDFSFKYQNVIEVGEKNACI